ncbi:STAS domain-containing protein [Pseudomonas sp.]|jgi:anti-sigma B factor antagonist|uniref:STAS domain-containing protein n=1 Tax=Pseudomonas sp. TaxID=306 RepID=UPI0037CAD28B
MNPMTYFLNDALVVTLEGALDAKAVHELRPCFEELAECGKAVVLDLSEVSFIDSSGIGAIVFLYKRLLVCNLRVNVVGLRPQPHELFLLLRIQQTILCHDSLKDYLACQPALTLQAAI